MPTFAAVSDCHGKLALSHLPPADYLLIAGDYCPNFTWDRHIDALRQLDWLKTKFVPLLQMTTYKQIVICAGNHDWVHLDRQVRDEARSVLKPAIYLENESVVLDGIHVYASPYQPWFHDWAFNFPNPAINQARADAHARRCWEQVPGAVDVLITHSPPYGVLDQLVDGGLVGCRHLRERVDALQPALHVFGHIHHSYGRRTVGRTQFGNVALCDESYEPVQPVQIFSI